jgi:hypothetical protein
VKIQPQWVVTPGKQTTNKTPYNLDRFQNTYTDYKGIKNNTNSGQITGIQEKLDTTCK